MATVTEKRAKRPITAAAGPYGHPFHPILVTIPIGAWPSHAFRVGVAHMGINLATVAIFIGDFVWRHFTYDEAGRTSAGQLLSAVGVGLLLVSGWLGGTLAYRFGVRVADEATRAEGFGR